MMVLDKLYRSLVLRIFFNYVKQTKETKQRQEVEEMIFKFIRGIEPESPVGKFYLDPGLLVI